MSIAVVAGNRDLLQKVLSNQGKTISQSLGRPIQDSRQQPSHAVVIARSPESIGGAEASCSFEVVLTQPTFRLDTETLFQVSLLMQHMIELCSLTSGPMSCLFTSFVSILSQAIILRQIVDQAL